MGKACGENCERLEGSIQEMTDQTKVEKLMVVSKMAGASRLLQLWTAIYPHLPIIGPSLICMARTTHIDFRPVLLRSYKRMKYLSTNFVVIVICNFPVF
jgi:hypothetical protein